MHYVHEQRPLPDIAARIVITVVFLGAWYVAGVLTAFSAAGIITAMLYLNTLRTEVDAAAFTFSYAYIVHGSIARSQIASVELSSIGIFYGSGIRWTPWTGWAWSIWPGDAVIVYKIDGSKVTIGSNDANALYAALA